MRRASSHPRALFIPPEGAWPLSYPGQIRSLVEVTSQTAIGEIGETTAARVLPCDDMLDLIRSDNVGFGKMAVFATIARPRADRLSEQFVHAYELGSVR